MYIVCIVSTELYYTLMYIHTFYTCHSVPLYTVSTLDYMCSISAFNILNTLEYIIHISGNFHKAYLHISTFLFVSRIYMYNQET